MPKTREELAHAIEDVLNVLREGIVLHGGDVELVSVHPESGRVEVRLIGACVGCPLSEMTLKAGIESSLRELVPEVKEVVQVE